MVDAKVFEKEMRKMLGELENCHGTNPHLKIHFWGIGDKNREEITIFPCLGYLDEEDHFIPGGNVVAEYPYLPEKYVTFYRCVSEKKKTEEIIGDPESEEHFLKWTQSSPENPLSYFRMDLNYDLPLVKKMIK
jgi:hypothetical protein